MMILINNHRNISKLISMHMYEYRSVIYYFNLIKTFNNMLILHNIRTNIFYKYDFNSVLISQTLNRVDAYPANILQ